MSYCLQSLKLVIFKSIKALIPIDLFFYILVIFGIILYVYLVNIFQKFCLNKIKEISIECHF